MAHTLSPGQADWLNKAVGTLEASAAKQGEAENHMAGQKTISDMLGNQREQMQKSLSDAKIVMANVGFTGAIKDMFGVKSKMAVLDKKKGAMGEVDTWHDLPEAESIPPETIAAITSQIMKVHAVQEELQKNEYYKLPTLSDPPTEEELEELEEKRRRLADDLWKPLEREGIIPENFIPDAYSEVTRTFDAASDLYQERLREYSDSLNDAEKLLLKFNLAVSIGEGVLDVAAASVGMVASVGDLTKNSGVIKDAAMAKDIIGLTKLALTSTVGAINAAVKDRDALGVADNLNNLVKGVLKQAGVDDEMANMIHGCTSAAIRSARTGKLLAEGKVDEAFAELGRAISTGLASVDQTDGDILTKMGKALQQGLQGAAGLDGVRKAVAEGRGSDALVIIMGQLPGIADQVSGMGDELKKITDDVKGVHDEQKNVNAQKGAFNERAMEALKEKANANQQKALEDFMKVEDEEFEELLVFGLSDPDDDIEQESRTEETRLASIEKLIAIQKRNDAIFKLAKTICTGGPGLVAELVPGMGLAAACAQLAFSIAEAIKHARQLLIWMDNVSDAKKAVTVQVDAMMNRYGLESRQTLEANIKVAIDAVKVAGEATKLAGEAAPAGYVVAAAADLASASLALASKIYTEGQMAAAWSTYKKALEVPQDRKLARESLRSNPTLAKYAMAWGALEDNNPIAKEAMRRCGLNERTLAQKETNVGKVVTYLETVYKEDPVLLRVVAVPKKWHPGEPVLTYKSWVAFCHKARTVAEPPLDAGDVSGVNAALGALDDARKAAETAIETALAANSSRASTEEPFDPDETLLPAAIKAAQTAEAALKRYRPVGADGEKHKEMNDYVIVMINKARAEQDSLSKAEDKKLWRDVVPS